MNGTVDALLREVLLMPSSAQPAQIAMEICAARGFPAFGPTVMGGMTVPYWAAVIVEARLFGTLCSMVGDRP